MNYTVTLIYQIPRWSTKIHYKQNSGFVITGFLCVKILFFSDFGMWGYLLGCQRSSRGGFTRGVRPHNPPGAHLCYPLSLLYERRVRKKNFLSFSSLSENIGFSHGINFATREKNLLFSRTRTDGWTTDDLQYLWKLKDPVQIVQDLHLPRFTLEKYISAYCNIKTNTGKCFTLIFRILHVYIQGVS